MIASKLEKIPVLGEFMLYVLKLFRFYFLYKPRWFINSVKNKENIFKIHHISPNQINYLSKARSSRINKRMDIGKIMAGDWDVDCNKFEDDVRFAGLRERFLEGKEWQDTVYYKRIIKVLENGGRANAVKDKQELNERLKNIDALYESIKKNGFREDYAEKIDTYSHKNKLFRKTKELEKSLDHIMVDVGRDGQYFFVSGRHRLAIAKILQVEKVPVIVRIRHKEWAEKMQNKNELEKMLEEGNISFSGYYESGLPDIVNNKEKGKTAVFLRKDKEHLIEKDNIRKSYYEQLADIRSQDVDVCFLDNEAIRILLARYPTAPSYVLVRLRPRASWLFGLPGLARRLWYKKIKLGGVVKLKKGKKRERWLVIVNRERVSLEQDSGLSSEIGIRGLIDYLNKEKARYVVLRFFENLSELHSAQRLNILVSDEDKQKVEEFIKNNPGDVKVSVRSPHSLLNNKAKISYYPPTLANSILDNAVEGPMNALTPSTKYYFLSFVYHVLYHKGFDAGVSSKLFPDEVDKNPEKDYGAVIKNLAEELNLSINITLEDLDEYLAKEGWRPKTDTLEKIAKNNEWLWRKLLAEEREKEIGLGVMILRERAVKGEFLENIVNIIEKDRFVVVRKKRIEKEDQDYVASHLRGGDWRAGAGDMPGHLPGMAIVVLDSDIVRLRQMGVETESDFDSRMRALKTKIRKATPEDLGNIIHSTDNTDQSWEYVKVCFPKEFSEIKKEIEKTCNTDISEPLLSMLVNKIRLFPHYIKMKIRHFVLGRVLR